jgi:hypothetical protein
MDFAVVCCGKTNIENNKRASRVNASSAQWHFRAGKDEWISEPPDAAGESPGTQNPGALAGVEIYLSRLAVSA